MIYTWYMYCLPARNGDVTTRAARRPRVPQMCTLSAEQSTIILWIRTTCTNCTRTSIWSLMRKVVGTRTYPVLTRVGRAMPPERVAVAERGDL